MDEPMVQDAVHVSAEPFQAAILGPDIWVAYGHQTFHCGLQVAKELPVLLPAEEHSKIYQRYSKRSFTTGTWYCTLSKETLFRLKPLVIQKLAKVS